jgi:hypothetical protein
MATHQTSRVPDALLKNEDGTGTETQDHDNEVVFKSPTKGKFIYFTSIGAFFFHYGLFPPQQSFYTLSSSFLQFSLIDNSNSYYLIAKQASIFHFFSEIPGFSEIGKGVIRNNKGRFSLLETVKRMAE